MAQLKTSNLFQFKIEQENRTLSLEPQPLEGGRVVPSGYVELVRYLHEGAAAPIGLRNVKLTSSEPQDEGPHVGLVSFELEPRHPTKAFVLIEQGWTLPGPWVDSDLLILDRNVVIDLEELPSEATDSWASPDRFWADLLGMCGSECHLLSFAVEGRAAQKPGLRAFLDEVSRAYRAAYRLFPREQLSPFDAARLQGGIGLIHDFERYFKKASAFLGKVLPALARPIPANERYSVFQRILHAADTSGFAHSELIVLLAISCLYDAAGGKHLKKPINPGRAILKPSKPNYYNAAFDSWLIELVIGGNAISDKRVGLVTKDKGLAAFWALLEPREFRMEGGVIQASITFSQQLFPAMPDKLFERFIDDLQD